MVNMTSSSDSSDEFFDARSEAADETSSGMEHEEWTTAGPLAPPNYEFERFTRKVVPMPVFPSLQDMETDFLENRLQLPDSVDPEQISIASWGKQLLLQTAAPSQLSPFTVTAVDSLSTKGLCSPQPPLPQPLDANFLSTGLKRSESSHSSQCRRSCLPAGRQWSSANNSRSGTIERQFIAETLNGTLVVNQSSTPSMRTAKSSSLNRDYCGLSMSHCLPEYPFEELADMRKKYSSAELIIDALTTEYNQNLRRSMQANTIVDREDAISRQPLLLTSSSDGHPTSCASTPVRPPRPKKLLKAANTGMPEGRPDLSVPFSAAPGLLVHGESSALNAQTSRPRSKDGVNSLKRDQQFMEGVNPLSLHMMRITQGEHEKPGSEAESVASSDSVSLSINTISSKIMKGGGLRSAMQKRIRALWHRANAKHQLSSRESSTSSDGEEVGDGSRGVQVRAAHHHKGPFYFEQLKLVQDLKGHHVGAVWSAKFSDCGRLLATAGQDNLIRIWVLKSAFRHFSDMRARYCRKDEPLDDPPSRENSISRFPQQAAKVVNKPQDAVGVTELSDSDPTFQSASAVQSSAEDVWAPFMPNPICFFKGHAADVLDVCWSTNYFILSSSMDRTVRLWHMSRSECLCRFQHCDFVTSIAFSVKDDRYFVSGSLDGKIRLWLIPEKKVVTWNELDEGQLVTAVSYVRGGDLIAVGTYDGRCIFYTSDKLTYHAQIDLRHYGLKRYRACKITGLDSWNDKLLITCNDSRIRLYDIRDLSLTCKYRGFTNSSSQIRARFNHDGQFIICGSEDSMVYIWKTRTDFNTLHLPRRKDRSRRWESIKAHNAVVTSALFAPRPDVIYGQIEKDRRRLCDREKLDQPDEDGFLLSPLRTGRVSIGSQSTNEVIVSADFAGVIYVFLNKPKVVAGSSVFLPT